MERGHSPEDSLNNRGTLKASLVAMGEAEEVMKTVTVLLISRKRGWCPQSLCLSVCMKVLGGPGHSPARGWDVLTQHWHFHSKGRCQDKGETLETKQEDKAQAGAGTKPLRYMGLKWWKRLLGCIWRNPVPSLTWQQQHQLSEWRNTKPTFPERHCAHSTANTSLCLDDRVLNQVGCQQHKFFFF